MIIEFKDESLTPKEKLQILLAYHNVPKHFVVDDNDIPMILMALNQDDVETITVNDDGSMEIGYSGDEWQNNEQRTI